MTHWLAWRADSGLRLRPRASSLGFGSAPVIFGFNTDLRVGPNVYHVQTEDRGPANTVLDTTIYMKGRIVHRRVSKYEDVLPDGERSPDAIRAKLEEQHRSIIEGLRSGELKFDVPVTPGGAAQPAADVSTVQVHLLNPASWLMSGTASLKLEVKSRTDQQPIGGARVLVTLNGTQGPVQFMGKTARDGKLDMTFPLPRMGGGGMELVITAVAPDGEDEIRYALRPRPKS